MYCNLWIDLAFICRRFLHGSCSCSVGNWRHVQLGICLIILFCSTFSCLPIEVETYDLDDVWNKLDVNYFPTFKKYIVESYFQKHQNLIDYEFEEFIAHELPLGLCGVPADSINLVAKTSVLQRSLIGEGSHRSLSSSIRFKLHHSEIATPSCKAIIIERLPPGVFADPFELQHLLQRRVFTDVAVFGDTNLELPTTLSNQSVVEIHIDIGSNNLLRDRDGIKINIKLPLHVRYPPLDNTGYSAVGFGAPDTFMQCSIKQDSGEKSCLILSVNDTTESKTGTVTGTVVWRVPSGIKAHTSFVSVITFLAALLSTILIVLASLCHRDTKSLC